MTLTNFVDNPENLVLHGFDFSNNSKKNRELLDLFKNGQEGSDYSFKLDIYSHDLLSSDSGFVYKAYLFIKKGRTEKVIKIDTCSSAPIAKMFIKGKNLIPVLEKDLVSNWKKYEIWRERDFKRTVIKKHEASLW